MRKLKVRSKVADLQQPKFFIFNNKTTFYEKGNSIQILILGWHKKQIPDLDPFSKHQSVQGTEYLIILSGWETTPILINLK